MKILTDWLRRQAPTPTAERNVGNIELLQPLDCQIHRQRQRFKMLFEWWRCFVGGACATPAESCQEIPLHFVQVEGTAYASNKQEFPCFSLKSPRSKGTRSQPDETSFELELGTTTGDSYRVSYNDSDWINLVPRKYVDRIR